MRILAVAPGPDFSVADVHRGWCEALYQLGHQVTDFNLSDRLNFYSRARLEVEPGVYSEGLSAQQAIELALNGLYAALYTVKPDLLLVTSAFYMSADLMTRARVNGTRIVVIHTESPYEDDRQIERAPYADINLINDPTNIERYRAVAPTHYLPHAYRPTVHYPRTARPEHRSDFAFVGTGYPSRVDFLERVDFSGIDVALAGHWSRLAPSSPLRKYLCHDEDLCCDNVETAQLYAGTKMSANLYRKEADRPELSTGWSMGPREVELAASGVAYLREPRGESDEVLPMLPTFSDPEEFGEQLAWWIEHDAERTEVAQQARAAVADRTFLNNATTLLRLLDS